MRLWFNLMCADIEAQQSFYRQLLGWHESARSRSPIYRALEHDGVQLGFNARAAYAMLALAQREPAPGADVPVTAFATFILDEPAMVDRAASSCAALGGRIVKPPYATYYGQWQAVLADPENHVFRVAAAALPEGVQAPPGPA